MKIGIDYIASLGGGGNSVYTKNLCLELTKIEEADFYLFNYFHDFIKRSNSNIRRDNVKYIPAYFSSLGNLKIAPLANRFSQKSFQFFSKFLNLDVFHFTNPLNYVENSVRNVVTIHDLSWCYNNAWTKNSSKSKMDQTLNSIVSKSRKIITVSQYTKKDLINITGIDGDKVEVVYEGVSEDFYPDLDRKSIDENYTTGDYILYVGQLQDRKNILNLIQAYCQAPDALKSKCKLILVGGFRDDGYKNKVLDLVAKLKLTDKVIFTNKVDIQELRKLYSNARFLVYPSFFEGFGLPVAESIKCGTPTITSNTSSLPEVGGSSSLYINPDDVDDIARAIGDLYYDHNKYSLLKNNTTLESKRFNWKKAALETLSVYKEINNQFVG